MDNFSLVATGEDLEELQLLLRIAFAHAGNGGRAVAYAEHPTLGFVLFWYVGSLETVIYDEPEDPTVKAVSAKIRGFNTPRTLVNCCKLVIEYLRRVEYPEKPFDSEVSHDKGWQIHNDYWGNVGSSQGAFIAVRPVWALSSK